MQISSSNRVSIPYGQKTIEFSLFYSSRKTLQIAVLPDSDVVVKAPLLASLEQVERKVLKRARWIMKQQSYFNQFQPKTPNRYYISGETHLYLGRHYRLKAVDGAKNSVKLSRGIIHVTSRSGLNSEAIKSLLDRWYLERAHQHLTDSFERCWQKFSVFGTKKPEFCIRRMQKRWGSLSAKGIVTLNTELVKAAKECIDYVVTHELCHLKHPDHGPGFYRLLESLFPEWQRVKHKLETTMA